MRNVKRGSRTLVTVLELKLDAVGGRDLLENRARCAAQIETSALRRNLQPRRRKRQPAGEHFARAEGFHGDPARGFFRIVVLQRDLGGTRCPLPHHAPVQSVLGVGRFQVRSLGVELVGLEAIPGSLGPLGGPKNPAGWVLGPQGRPKSQQNQYSTG